MAKAKAVAKVQKKARTVWREIEGGVTAPRGFTAAGVAAGVKSGSGKKDLACLFADRPSAWAAVLTTNRFAAAPVQITRRLLKRGGRLQAVVVNSGNANAATGPDGEKRALKVAAAAAKVLAMPVERVAVASTGIIGRPLPADRIGRALARARAQPLAGRRGARRRGDHDHGHLPEAGGPRDHPLRRGRARRRDVR